MKKIIFIEGVSGVGKTTTVNALNEKLHSLGYSIKYYVEGDRESPLDLNWVAYLTVQEYNELINAYPAFADKFSEDVIFHGDYILLRYQIRRTPLYPQELHKLLHKHEFCYNPTCTVPLSKFTEVFLNLWQHFAESYEGNWDYMIFDASLVSHMTNDLIRNYKASEDDMVKHLETLIQTINHFNPIVFYLSSHNVRECLIEARKSRGQIPLSEEQIRFWEKRKQIDLPVLSRLSVESHVMDVSYSNWDSVISEIVLCVTASSY